MRGQVWTWGAVLLALLVLEVFVIARKPVISDSIKVERLHEYWNDPTPENQQRWQEADKAFEAKQSAARRLRYTLLFINLVCIGMAGLMLTYSLHGTASQRQASRYSRHSRLRR